MSTSTQERPQQRPIADDLERLKVPPHSLEAEQSVIGGLLLDNEAWDVVSDLVMEGDFFRAEHRMIFATISILSDRSSPFDVVTLSDHLESTSQLESAGGLAYLGELAKNTPSVANIKAYASIVREKSVLRQLLSSSSDIANMVYFTEGRACEEILDLAEQKIFAIAENQEKEGGPVLVKNMVSSVAETLDKLMASEGGITGTATGYTDLDKMTCGLQAGDMIVVAGRPSSGKTTFAMNIAENIAMTADKPALVFSMEMPQEQIVMRSLASLGRVDQTKIRSGNLNEQEMGKVFSALQQVGDHMNCYIDDSPALSPTELRSRARRVAREHGGLSCIVVDYLQLMQVPGNNENRTVEVSEISRGLKALAKELSVPLIACSQLSRKVEDRSDKRPMNSDLRESGAIEQDADLIMFIYRDEVYNPNTEDKGIAEIIIGKQRNGPIGSLRLTFQGKYARFDDHAPRRIGL